MMDRDKYINTIGMLLEKILTEFGVKVHDEGSHIELETAPAMHKEHILRLAAIMSLQSKLFDYSLMLAIALKEKNDGIAAINSLLNKKIELINMQADKALELYLDNGVTTRKEEAPNE